MELRAGKSRVQIRSNAGEAGLLGIQLRTAADIDLRLGKEGSRRKGREGDHALEECFIASHPPVEDISPQ